MRTSIFKKSKPVFSHFFRIYDVKAKYVYLSILILLAIFIYSFLKPIPSNYFASIKAQYKLISIERIYDYICPLLASFIICLVFYRDYKNKTYQFLAFYQPHRFNYTMFCRWIFYVSIFCIGSFISCIFYFRHVAFLNGTSILLSIRYLPNILFLSALMLFVTAITKNSYNGLFITLLYYIWDILFPGRFFKIFAIGAHSANFYYAISKTYYYMNRILISVMAIILLFVSCFISSQRR